MRFLHGTSLRWAAELQRVPTISAGLYLYRAGDPGRLRDAEAFAMAASRRDDSPAWVLELELPEEAVEVTPERRGFAGALLAPHEVRTAVDVPSSSIVTAWPSPRAIEREEQLSKLRALGLL